MPAAPSRLLLPCLLGLLLLSACRDAPTAPTEDAHPEQTSEANRPPPTGSRAAIQLSPVLDALLRQAIAEVTAAHGDAAARALTVELRRLQEEARRARAAGDEEGFQRALRALEAEAARLVVRVLGREPVLRTMALLEARLRELEERIRQAEAAGRDVTALRQLAQRATELLQSAGAAMAAGEPVPALLAASQAATLLGGLPGPPRAAARVGLLQGLLAEAIQRVTREHGPEAARALTARLQALEERVRQAREAGDEAALNTATDALEGEMAAIVVRVLGPETAVRVLRQATELLRQLRARIAEAEASGRDVTAMKQLLQNAGERLQRAERALAARNPAQGLMYAARALDLLAGPTNR